MSWYVQIFTNHLQIITVQGYRSFYLCFKNNSNYILNISSTSTTVNVTSPKIYEEGIYEWENHLDSNCGVISRSTTKFPENFEDLRKSVPLKSQIVISTVCFLYKFDKSCGRVVSL